MKGIISCILFFIVIDFASGQSNFTKFKNLEKTNDTAKINAFLTEWQKSEPNDPEIYTSCMNYYYKKSKEEIVTINKTPHGKSSFKLTDSTGAVAGYLNSNSDLNPRYLDSVFYYANIGIIKFPKRLDIRFGKTYILGEMEDYNNFSNEIIKTIEYSKTIKNDWLWTENKKVEDPENFMLNTIQTYLKQLYEIEDDKLLENMKSIGNVVLNYYPNNIEILSTTAVANMLTGNYEKAIEYLKRAEKINPEDFIILNNLAKGYELKGNIAEAIHYYELTEKFGDDEAKEHSKKEIIKLKSEQ
ncbi:MAG TPA: tetratricopeptide repeat protein [Puia sp.]|jgi:tetratricopeptide (TPR) repeat protein|nr:tetratricopeptide repeat protein [Puia sp.]